MPARRIIPCLDVKDGRVVKGVQFRDHRDVGDIVEHALRYRDEGADELVFYDITASAEGRSLDPAWVRRIARVIDIPFAVAGGIRTPRPGRRLPRRRRRQGLDQLARARAAGADRGAGPRFRQPVRRARRRQLRATTATIASSNIPAASRRPATPACARSTGCARRPSAAPARSCSTACAATACAPATTSPTRTAVVEAVDGAGDRLGRRRRARAFPRRLRRGRRERRARRHRLPRPADRHPRTEGVSRAHAGSKCAADRGRHRPRSTGTRWTACCPPIVQDAATRQLLMLGYMNREALDGDAGRAASPPSSAARRGGCGRRARPAATVSPSARSTPIATTTPCWCCAEPAGPTCHLGTDELLRRRRRRRASAGSAELARIVARARGSGDPRTATPRACSAKGPTRIAQKIGEEGVELALAGAGRRRARRASRRAADLLYHLTVLMEARGFGWDDVAAVLAERHVTLAGARAASERTPQPPDGSGPRTDESSPSGLHRLVEQFPAFAAARTWPALKSSPPRQLPIIPPAPRTTGISAL